MDCGLDCQIYDRGTIPAQDCPFRIALPVHTAVNGSRDLPWKLNAAERSADHIASRLVSSLWSSGTAVEVHAEGPVSIPIASKDEDILHGPY